MIDSRRLTPYSDGLDVAKIELVPLDLLYDEQFLTAVIDEVIPVGVKKKPITTNESDKLPDQPDFKPDNQLESPSNFEFVDSETVQSTEKTFKWEKVKKKVRLSLGFSWIHRLKWFVFKPKKARKPDSPALETIQQPNVTHMKPPSVSSPTTTAVEKSNMVFFSCNRC